MFGKSPFDVGGYSRIKGLIFTFDDIEVIQQVNYIAIRDDNL